MTFIFRSTILGLNRENGEVSLTPGIGKSHPQSLGDLVTETIFSQFREVE